jgi:4-phosphopantoate---beta-alanine ligase
MTRLSPRHPRYRSLVTRAHLAEESRRGVVAPEGLIAQGRGEAFDYFLGERTTASARRAERIAAHWLLAARRPVVSVNGNVAALAAPLIAQLADAVPTLLVEVNLFHRSPERVRMIADRLRDAGVRGILGLRPTARIPGLPSDRALVDADGIARCDVCLVPLEDGDRTAALRRLGKRVISIDLNPMSRTSVTSDLPIVDELSRALSEIARFARSRPRGVRAGKFPAVDAPTLLAAARRTMARGLTQAGRPPSGGSSGRSGARPPRGSAGRSRRTRRRSDRRRRSPPRSPRRPGPERRSPSGSR